ncbi:uncharacterized protein LACBIDRAFT_331313 [Laccaria bicolor S238N-H82]|uniref:Predicted protein n=1 Tax=Laccaria bicolor (strain S238N-H82 / ATCC MYA-4686) TaxID=486041 RepID=B0DP35_LACBS|nr:uncharacterized protein LACBIDRAFT_331313 [Laccaria bicolor S238N-H82]EDR03543.1 predicted protein [Laccaria bicolor S238N-H82]|eukprot:XP_001885691.1 predicted protein [Laccaria bicolor S238N-H82]
MAQKGLRQFLGHWDHVEVCGYKSYVSTQRSIFTLGEVDIKCSVNIRGQPFVQRQPQILSSTSVVLFATSWVTPYITQRKHLELCSRVANVTLILLRYFTCSTLVSHTSRAATQSFFTSHFSACPIYIHPGDRLSGDVLSAFTSSVLFYSLDFTDLHNLSTTPSPGRRQYPPIRVGFQSNPDLRYTLTLIPSPKFSIFVSSSSSKHLKLYMHLPRKWVTPLTRGGKYQVTAKLGVVMMLH